MKFELIKFDQLNKDSFAKFSTWAQYYEPDDIETLQKLGFDKSEVSRTLEAVGYSDDYCFPIPNKTSIGSFQFEHRKAIFRTSDDINLNGYVVNSGYAIDLFGAKEEWILNINILETLEEKINGLKLDLGLNKNNELLPLKVIIPDTKSEFIFGSNG